MLAMPEDLHDVSACQAAHLARLCSLDHVDTDSLVELFRCLEEASGTERAEIAKAILEIISPDMIYSGLEVDPPIAVDARGKVDNYRREVGKRIARRRQELGLTQQALAAATGLPQSHVSRLERGKHAPTYITIERIATALDVEAGWLDPGCDD